MENFPLRGTAHYHGQDQASNIYGMLVVHRRTQAIARARELNLL